MCDRLDRAVRAQMMEDDSDVSRMLNTSKTFTVCVASEILWMIHVKKKAGIIIMHTLTRGDEIQQESGQKVQPHHNFRQYGITFFSFLPKDFVKFPTTEIILRITIKREPLT